MVPHLYLSWQLILACVPLSRERTSVVRVTHSRPPPPRFPWPPDLRRVNALSFMPAAVASSLPLTHPWKALPPAVAVTATWLAVRAESEEALAAVGAADGWPPRPAAPAPLR